MDPTSAEESHPLNELRREVQQMKSQVLELSAESHKLKAELIGIREMLDDKKYKRDTMP